MPGIPGWAVTLRYVTFNLAEFACRYHFDICSSLIDDLTPYACPHSARNGYYLSRAVSPGLTRLFISQHLITG